MRKDNLAAARATKIKEADFDEEHKFVFKPKDDNVIYEESKDIINKINQLQTQGSIVAMMN